MVICTLCFFVFERHIAFGWPASVGPASALTEFSERIVFSLTTVSLNNIFVYFSVLLNSSVVQAGYMKCKTNRVPEYICVDNSKALISECLYATA